MTFHIFTEAIFIPTDINAFTYIKSSYVPFFIYQPVCVFINFLWISNVCINVTAQIVILRIHLFQKLFSSAE